MYGGTLRHGSTPSTTLHNDGVLVSSTPKTNAADVLQMLENKSKGNH